MTVLSLDTMKAIGNGQATKIIFPFELTKLVEGASQYLGVGRQTPQREVTDMVAIEKAVGKADEVLGPIPTPEELHAELKAQSTEEGKIAESREEAEVEAIVRRTAAAKKQADAKRQASIEE